VATPPSTDHEGLSLGVAAAWLRRTLGPVAWAVLEVLAETAELHGDRTVSCCSVRGLATELRLASDTVARALRRLADSGLLHHESDRDAGGRFGLGRYVLTLPPNVFDIAGDLEHPSPSKPVSKARASRSCSEQLVLLSES
jgi:hypothetical protein